MNLPLFWFRAKKRLRMVWRVEKEGRRSYLVGTAHFFPYSFAGALSRLLEEVETVIFEGPLDEASREQIAAYGRQGDHSPSLAEALDPAAIKEINRQLSRRLDGQDQQSGNGLYLFLPLSRPNYFEMYTQGMRPWAAFFSIWSTCLNWQYSMDMEAFQIAHRLGKQVRFLESIEEQLVVLDGIPFERIVRQLNEIKNWPPFTERYVRFFLEGNLEELMSLTDSFTTRGRPVIMERDFVFFEQMKRIFAEETAVACVGFPHIPGVRRLLLEEGYRVSQEVR